MAHVLVVDDDPDIRELVQLNLEARGHLVTLANDGVQALMTIRDIAPDAIVLDVMMPGSTGWDVLKELKASKNGDASAVPVVMVTGMADDSHKIRSGIEGAIRFLGKPFDPAELIRLVEEVLALGPEHEPIERREILTDSLKALAGAESETSASERAGSAIVKFDRQEVRLTNLEREPERAKSNAVHLARVNSEKLSDKQRALLLALSHGSPVTDVAASLGTTRSNVYAGLQRICRLLEVETPKELLAMVRSGILPV